MDECDCLEDFYTAFLWVGVVGVTGCGWEWVNVTGVDGWVKW